MAAPGPYPVKSKANSLIMSMYQSIKEKIYKIALSYIMSRKAMFRKEINSGSLVLDRVFIETLMDDAACQRVITQGDTVHKLFFEKGLEENQLYKRILVLTDFIRQWRTYQNFASFDKEEFIKKLPDIIKNLKKPQDVDQVMLNLICETDHVHLNNGILKFYRSRQLWIIINEILIDEEYFFETDTKTPRILDCGTNFGLAIYYFKNLFPDSRITGFEPHPQMRELAEQNIRSNHYSNVEILPFALSDEEKTSEFIIPECDSLAGSLTKRRENTGEPVKKIQVQCTRLSSFLKEPVHFLKLDIEGSESIVLRESKDYLKNVQHIFCEYHYEIGNQSNRLGGILTLLEENGFEAHVAKSWGIHSMTHQKPMNFVGQSYTALIWAKNKNWVKESP